MYSLTTVFAIVAIFPFVSLYWLWICFQAYRRGEFWPHLAVQVSIVMFILWLLAYANFAIAAAMSVAPPIAIGLIIDRIIAESPPFVLVLVAATIPFGGVAYIACLKFPNLRKWTVSIVSAAVFVSGFFIAEILTNRVMCKAAEPLGIAQFERRTSLWSFKELPAEHGRSVHAAAGTPEKKYGWSYYNQQWFELRDDISPSFRGISYHVRCRH